MAAPGSNLRLTPLFILEADRLTSQYANQMNTTHEPFKGTAVAKLSSLVGQVEQAKIGFDPASISPNGAPPTYAHQS